ncbi:MAG TPA: hypothetical protein VFW73_03515, partial [Lacipirellulaceae bacterium]|nr:hypothetical protein [Lacipirellulaceae bacterium]
VDCRWKGWGKDRLELHSVDTHSNRPLIAIRVAPQDRDAVEHILEARRNRSPLLIDIGKQVGLGKASIIDVIGKEHFRRHSWRVVVGIICTAGLVGLGLLRPTGISEFDDVRLYGLYFGVFVLSFERRWSLSRGGTPVAQLFARRGWTVFLLMLSVALTLYVVNSYMFWPTDWMATIAGFAFWYLTIKVATYFCITQLDLRLNGIVMPGALFCRWSKIKVVKWDPALSNELVLRVGSLSPIFATVPSEHRDAIAKLLKEKVEGNS